MPKKTTVRFFSADRLSRRYLSAALGWLLGGTRLKNGHLPPAGHPVAAEFTGVGVAASDAPGYLAFVEDQLQTLGVRQIRVDYCQGSTTATSDLLLDSLVARGNNLLLHLIQPFEQAQQMASLRAQQDWRRFVEEALERWGARVEAVEIGSTLNRKRWTGYSLHGFVQAWRIAHDLVRARGITLVGPNITDFEPLHTAGVLALLNHLKCPPDVYSNNLFAERAVQPENWDQKILGHRLAPLLKINLIKKARLVQKTTARRGLPRVWSPSAFWTLPRIGRILTHTEQQQADYLARYLLLCSASGALERAWWGPLICAREGLIDDGTDRYPATERITRYDRADGDPAHYRRRPAFAALGAFARLIPGGDYLGRQSRHPQLEIHAFWRDGQLLHALWTRNGRAAPLTQLYRAEDLATARVLDRDGQPLAELPELITQSPLYLGWSNRRTVTLQDAHTGPLAKLVLCPYGLPGHYYPVEHQHWRGMVRAASAVEATQLIAGLHPDTLPGPAKEGTLRLSRNAIWTIADPRDARRQLVVKQPVRLRLNKRITDRFKPSKARRSWNGSCELLRRGIATPLPVAFIESKDPTQLTRNWYICDYLPSDQSVRSFFSAYARGDNQHQGIERQVFSRQLAGFLLDMHNRGVFFRDLSGGNILVQRQADGAISFALIDTGRATFAEFRGIGMSRRIADLKRTCHKLDWAGREEFMQIYLAQLGRRYGWRYRLPFYLYDLKAGFKRRLKGKAAR